MVLCQVTLLVLTLANSAFATHSPDWAECAGNADEKIKAACTAIIEQQSRSPQELARALVWRGVWYRNHGQSDEAYADFDRAVNLDPRHVPGLIGRGLVLQAQSRLVAAYVDFTNAIAIAPKDSYSYLLRGDILVRMGRINRVIADYDRAIDDYAKVLILEPNHPSAQRMKEAAQKSRAELLVVLFGGNIPANSRVISGQSTVQSITQPVAKSLPSSSQKDVAPAANSANSPTNGPTDRDPIALTKWLAQKFPGPGYRVGPVPRPEEPPKPPPAATSSKAGNRNVYWPPGFPNHDTPATPWASSIKRKYDDTVVIASKAITAAIAPAGVLSGRLALRGQIESALEHFEHMLADVPDHNDALVGRGYTYLLLGRFDEASADFDRALDASPDNGKALVGQGLLSLSGGQLDSALGNFNDAIGIDPQDEYGYALRGDVRARKGQWTEASADFERAMALKPESAELLVIRGMAHHRDANWASAILDYDRAIELDSNYFDAYEARGHAFAGQRDFGNAQADYDRALLLVPEHQRTQAKRDIARKSPMPVDLCQELFPPCPFTWK